MPPPVPDWTALLAQAGIPEPPGRAEAVAAAQEATRQRYEKTGGEPPRKKGSSKRKPDAVAGGKAGRRAQLRAKEG